MPSSEFTMWRAFHKLYPFGYDIENYRMGSICAAVSNMAGKTLAKPVSPSKFYPDRPKQKKELTPRQLKQLEKKRKAKQNGHR